MPSSEAYLSDHLFLCSPLIHNKHLQQGLSLVSEITLYNQPQSAHFQILCFLIYSSIYLISLASSIFNFHQSTKYFPLRQIMRQQFIVHVNRVL
uniref:Uncharacterized protein n=1 Tax=Manihot esculenta TaxID=3983 RepID=A0A2C9U8D8_MANES